MAVIKHISVKGSNGRDALNYVLYKHNERTGELIVDGRGNPVMRDEYYLDGINCEPYSFAAECKEVNDLYGKNQLPGDLKAHHFIISYDPKDGVEHGLTGPKAQQLSMEWAERCLPGFQILVCTHMDGSNESGNIHTHIMMNSVRKCDTKSDDFGERAIDHLAGYKLNLTKNHLQFMKQQLMDICEREGLYQVDLLLPSRNRITDKEYRVHQHGKDHIDKLKNRLEKDEKESTKTVFQTQKQYLRDAVKNVASKATSFDDFCTTMKKGYNITVKENRGRISYLHPERKKYITGRALGTDYEKEPVLKMISRDRTIRSNEGEKTSINHFDIPTRIETLEDCKKVFAMHTELKLVVRLQEHAKAHMRASYINNVALSNVKAIAETILFVQQYRLETLDNINEEIEKEKETVKILGIKIVGIEKQVEEINEELYCLGQCYANRDIISERHNQKDNNSFIILQRNELAANKSARKNFIKKYDNESLPKSSVHKKQKEVLEETVFGYRKQQEVARQNIRTLETVKKNISKILNAEKTNMNTIDIRICENKKKGVLIEQ